MTDLEDLHELPWSEIEGATVHIRQEIDERDPLDPRQDNQMDLIRTEERKGTIAGRHRGWKVKYLPDTGDFAEPVSPTIVIETPEDTYLEVATDMLGNELLEFDPQGETDE